MQMDVLLPLSLSNCDVHAGYSDPSRLEVVNRHGPCSSFKQEQKPTQKQILDADQLRVEWLNSRAKNGRGKGESSISLSATQLPTQRGDYLGSADYVITVGFGTPKVTQSIIFDTGSDVSWIQCQPCDGSNCYPQAEELFDPRQSSTYSNISCSSAYCSALSQSGCEGNSTCLYGVQYADNSSTTGFYAEDTLTLTSSDVIPNYRFGCGEKNTGDFGKVAGLLGLGRLVNVSFIEQTFQRYSGVFSYCLPSSNNATGYLAFGQSSVLDNTQFTPILTNTGMPSFYFVELMSISVAGVELTISPTLFSVAGTILDSGTVITRLPPTAYAALRDAFQQRMTAYQKAPAAGFLDTCYDFSQLQSVSVPSVALNFRGASVNLDGLGIIYVISNTQYCLAFAPNGADTDLVIIGNTQQKTYSIVHDLAKGTIGFGPKGC